MTDGSRVLLGHATRSPRWDIFKGLAEPGESFEAAARRELLEETGIDLTSVVLSDLGIHRYLPAKALALFVWQPEVLPDPKTLICRSQFTLPNGLMVPELDHFAVFPWPDALAHVGRNLARVLATLDLS